MRAGGRSEGSEMSEWMMRQMEKDERELAARADNARMAQIISAFREDLSIARGNIRRLDQDVRLERETSDALRVENERLRQALTWIAHTYAHQGSMKPLPAIDYQDHARAALSQRDEPK